MNIKEMVCLSRVVISTALLILSGWLAVTNAEGFGWFLFVAVLIFPNQINIDFREKK